MTNKTELLPCPFCGAAAKATDEMFGSVIHCDHLHTCPLDGHEKLAAAASEWNTRAAPAEDAREVVDEPVACQLYHVTESGLAEGTALGQITVVLVADFERLNAENAALKSELERLNRQKPREYLEHSCTWPSPVCECQACKLKFNK